MDLAQLKNLYKDNLLNDVIPFWLKYSGDWIHGGYYSCLGRKGNVYDTDKFMWLQGRQIWIFAMLYNELEQKREWLEFAELGTTFVSKHGMDVGGNWYFSLDKAGNPLTKPFNIFTDCFAAMGFAQMYKATVNEQYAEIGRNTFYNILKRLKTGTEGFGKVFPGTRNLKSFTPPMILTNLVMEVRDIIAPEVFNHVIEESSNEVINHFYRKDLGVTLENITVNNDFSDSFEGRLVNPGHGLEAMWFVMDIAKSISDMDLMQKAIDSALSILNFGWDKEEGGIFYFLDIKEAPVVQLEWDQKLWWVHLEAMVAMAKGYLFTANKDCLRWFYKLHDYTFSHFADTEYGEWFGYLNRQGKVLIDLKGGKWKGCFHVPRSLYQLYRTLSQILDSEKTTSFQ